MGRNKLRNACKARLYKKTQVRKRKLVQAGFAHGARPNNVYVTLDKVDDLRQFIQARAPQEVSTFDGQYPVGGVKIGTKNFGGIFFERTYLVEFEGFFVLSKALARVKKGARLTKDYLNDNVYDTNNGHGGYKKQHTQQDTHGNVGQNLAE